MPWFQPYTTALQAPRERATTIDIDCRCRSSEWASIRENEKSADWKLGSRYYCATDLAKPLVASPFVYITGIFLWGNWPHFRPYGREPLLCAMGETNIFK